MELTFFAFLLDKWKPAASLLLIVYTYLTTPNYIGTLNSFEFLLGLEVQNQHGLCLKQVKMPEVKILFILKCQLRSSG